MKDRSKQINRVKVNIDGEDYCIKGAVPKQHIERAASLVDEKIVDLAESHPYLSRNKIAVLAALNIADEFLRIKEENEELIDLLDVETKG